MFSAENSFPFGQGIVLTPNTRWPTATALTSARGTAALCSSTTRNRIRKSMTVIKTQPGAHWTRRFTRQTNLAISIQNSHRSAHLNLDRSTRKSRRLSFAPFRHAGSLHHTRFVNINVPGTWRNPLGWASSLACLPARGSAPSASAAAALLKHLTQQPS